MLKSLLFALLLSAGFCSAAAKPNIIYVLADDLGWTDLACQGSKYYETPNIDRLASQGMRLTSYYNCQNCQPTRAALMSGQYSARTGVYTVGGIGRFEWESRPLRPADNVTELPLDRIILPQALKKAGYATAMFGKWHLGEDKDHHPGARGFDEAIVSMGRHFDFATNPKTPYAKGTYLADFLTDKAEDFIRRHKEGPFFLYLPHFGVHSPHQAKENWIEHFKPKAGVGGHNNATYAAMIASVDESVGRIMALLDELKLADNTVLVFSSDNGGVGGYSREGIDGGDITDNTPLRSGKGSLHDGGIRDPWIVRWPGVVKPGTTCDTPAHHVDVYPTLLEIAGAAKPEGYTLDGLSMVPLLRDPAATLPRDGIYWHFPGYLGAGNNTWRTTPVSVVRAGDWKLMEFLEDGAIELYNITADIGEKNNLAATQPEKTAALLKQLHTWRKNLHAAMPTKNTDIKPVESKGKGKNKAKADE